MSSHPFVTSGVSKVDEEELGGCIEESREGARHFIGVATEQWFLARRSGASLPRFADPPIQKHHSLDAGKPGKPRQFRLQPFHPAGG
jgi:hypothetical protein